MICHQDDYVVVQGGSLKFTVNKQSYYYTHTLSYIHTYISPIVTEVIMLT